MSGPGRPWWHLPLAVVAVAAIAVVALVAVNGVVGDDETVADTGATQATGVEPGQSEPGQSDSSDTESSDTEVTNQPSELEIVVVAEYSHDSTYTQGLEFIDSGPDSGLLLESGGQRGESVIRVWNPVTGQIVRSHDLDGDLFAEGATLVGDEALQLTWQAETAFRYDVASLTPIDEVSYAGEGWGLCQLGSDLVMSDGSSTLTFRDPDTFEAMASVNVTRGGAPVENLNELECVASGDSDLVWANVYQTAELMAIDPETGQVVHTVDAAALVPDDLVGNSDLVLNGIAYSPDTDRFWLTGKRWPVLYEVELR